MEIVFLTILIAFMVIALTSGFPVAFSLPGSAVLTIGLAALTGYMFEGDVSAYFAQGGPVEWLTAGVTNFRSLYWIVERDTLIAIPLFVFMGIMLQRSKIAEDLLIAMARLFGPVPGGLGISVVFVGALLAATTGIVGATVIAMGLISLPAMLRNNYSKPLASGIICASGTLGQIIPPSIVLIILADQLSSAADQASTLRKQAYKAATGEFSMPSSLDVVSASAGDMFMGAFIPGMILVGLYMLYILVSAILKPESAPPVPFEGAYDREFAKRILMALVPPLTLIFVVLGSIILGVATVNQAGAIGAIGAMIMGGYRLTEGKKRTYWPAILAGISLIGIMWVVNSYHINVKNIASDEDARGVMFAVIAVAGLLIAVFWSAWRTYKIDNTLTEVMIETAKTTSMVFIILLGAAMLTSAFRAFGGEELVKHFLTGLPGGFWTQFLVVMLVMFVLGFFLDFIEIAVVVVPIVAPILLSDPGANITAVWFGVMVGLNIQTSFLTPPFGFALFYLRGVAPPSVKTTHIYKGAVAFIALQVLGLGITGYFPSLVNYLPFSTYLTSENAPPPINPRLQQCMRDHLFEYYEDNKGELMASIQKAQKLDVSYLPDKLRSSLSDGFTGAGTIFAHVEDVKLSKQEVLVYEPNYRPVHTVVRGLQKQERILHVRIAAEKQNATRERRADEPNAALVAQYDSIVHELESEVDVLQSKMPVEWDEANAGYVKLQKVHERAIRDYNDTVDSAYEKIPEVLNLLTQVDELELLRAEFAGLEDIVNTSGDAAKDLLKEASGRIGALDGLSKIKSLVYKASKAMKTSAPNPEKALKRIAEAKELFESEVTWRKRAKTELAPALIEYDNAIKTSIGLRLQQRLPASDAKDIAMCQSVHRDISLHF